MSNTAWLIVALIVVFAAIGGYALGLVLREKKLRRDLEGHSGVRH
jgi:hypothetical protein